MRSGPERARRLYLQEASFWSSSPRMERVSLLSLMAEVKLMSVRRQARSIHHEIIHNDL
jgi:hypothetical protein